MGIISSLDESIVDQIFAILLVEYSKAVIELSYIYIYSAVRRKLKPS